jgi:hypothetical protein
LSASERFLIAGVRPKIQRKAASWSDEQFLELNMELSKWN